jgi:predicted acyl esterase
MSLEEQHVGQSSIWISCTFSKRVDVHKDGSAFNISEGIPAALRSRSTKPVSLRLPRFDRNLNTGNMIASEHVISAKQTVSHGSIYPSRLVLPMIPARSSGVPVITGCPQTVSV